MLTINEYNKLSPARRKYIKKQAKKKSMSVKDYLVKNVPIPAPEQVVKKAVKKGAGKVCSLLIIKIGDKEPKLEFMSGEVGLTDNPTTKRNDCIDALHNNWGHDGRFLGIAAEYLSHSPSLHLASSGIKAKFMLDINTGLQQQLDLNNLGCILTFKLDGKQIGTTGPQWCTPEEVKAEADKLKQNNRLTHSIRGRR